MMARRPPGNGQRGESRAALRTDRPIHLIYINTLHNGAQLFFRGIWQPFRIAQKAKQGEKEKYRILLCSGKIRYLAE